MRASICEMLCTHTDKWRGSKQFSTLHHTIPLKIKYAFISFNPDKTYYTFCHGCYDNKNIIPTTTATHSEMVLFIVRTKFCFVTSFSFCSFYSLVVRIHTHTHTRKRTRNTMQRFCRQAFFFSRLHPFISIFILHWICGSRQIYVCWFTSILVCMRLKVPLSPCVCVCD